jgi:hypothetical protein
MFTAWRAGKERLPTELPLLWPRSVTAVDHIRLFRNHPDMTWSYRVHEQILPALDRLQASLRRTDVVMHHVGYQDTVLRRRKLERDRRQTPLRDKLGLRRGKNRNRCVKSCP